MLDLTKERVIVTGASGFLGRRLMLQLGKMGVACRPIDHRAFDLTSFDDVDRMITVYAPSVIFHLAARCGGIGANLRSPADFIMDNLMMGLNIIKRCGAPFTFEKIVVAGTVCSYPLYNPQPFQEIDFWSGYPEPTNAPYGIAKKTIGVAMQAYHRQHGLKCAFPILANLYGPGDSFDENKSHVVPALVKKIVDAERRADKTVTLWGSGGAARELLHVDDAARALIRCAEVVDDPSPMNFGSGHVITIIELAQTIAEMVGWKGAFEFDKSKPDGQPSRSLDWARAKKETGWRPLVSLDEGIQQVIDDYRKRVAESDYESRLHSAENE